MRVVPIGLIAPMLLVVAASTASAQAPRPQLPDSGRRVVAPIQASSDTSMLTGSGLNTKSWAIDRPVPGGVMRKDPGSSTWYFVKALSDAEMRGLYDKHIQELIAKHGNEPRDIKVVVRDTFDVAKLRKYAVPVTRALPCTLETRVLYRQLFEMRADSLLFWGKDDKRVPPGAPTGKQRPQPMVPTTPKPQGTAPSTRSQSPSGPEGAGRGGGIESPQAVTIFSDGFESATVPGTYWSVGDLQSNSGSDYWGRLSNSCGQVRTGSYAVQCAGFSDTPCFSYDNDMDAYMYNPAFFSTSAYPSVDLSFYVWYSTYSSSDWFKWFYQYDTGIGWIQDGPTYSGYSFGWNLLGRTVTGVSQIAMQFRFFSDPFNTDEGAYVDDVQIRGNTLDPNLTSYTPPGWSAPIVPSSVTGTTTTGTLYTGQTTYLDWGIQNNGTGGAGGFYIDFFLDGSTSLGYRSEPLLGAGLTDSRPDDITFVVNTPGTHTIRMVIDSLPPQVSESNESDNGITHTFTWVAPPQPDLIVQSLVPSSTTPTVGQTITVTATIKNQGAGPANGTIYTDFYQNPGSPPNQGQPYDQTHATLSLAAGATDVFQFTGIASQFAVPWTMYAYVDGTNANAETNETNNRSSGVAVTWTAGTTTITGTLAYNDTSFAPGTGPQHPMRCIPVTLYDSDGGNAGNSWAPDDSLAVTVTDASGNFSFPPITNRDTDADQGRLDLYVRAQAKNDVTCIGNAVVAVKDSALRYREWRSTAASDVANGTVPLGTLKPTDYASRVTFHLYDTFFKGYDWALARGLAPPEGGAWYCEAVWQPGYVGPYGLTAYAGRKIHVVGEPTVNPLTPDEWDDGVVLHEYGHFLADLFHFEPTIPGRPPDGCPHDPTMQAECPPGTPSVQFAWSEGWPNYFACLTQGAMPTPTRRNTGARKSGNNWADVHWYEMDIETGGNSQDNGIPLASANDGMLYEVANAGVLWDIYDSVVDNQNGDACADNMVEGLDHAWDVTANHPSNPNWNLGFFYRLYWERYTQANPTLDQQLTEVYCEHGIPASGGNTVSAPGLANLRLALGVAPNPARGPVVLTYAIPADLGNAPVEISVFDVTGRLVRRLQRGSVGPGTHQIAWNGEDGGGNRARSGMYFCRLIVADQKRLLAFVVVR